MQCVVGVLQGERVKNNYPQISQIYADFLDKITSDCAKPADYRIYSIRPVW